ncbi:MAG TPA: hypothetical protein VMT50_02455, partial [Steroidobacteraceae bacterium]|nr:hypothetical protein [Steroidobacteraceae bacterium]
MTRQFLRVSGVVLVGLGVAVGAAYMLTRAPPGRLTFNIETTPAVMSAAYKVYGNRSAGDGRYWLSKVVIKNEGGSPVEDVTASFQVPGFVEWTNPKSYPRILPGQTVVSLFYPRFPDTVATKTTTTTEHVEMKVEYADRGGGKHQETRETDFQLRGRNDLIYTTLPEAEILTTQDLYENTDLAAAFVTPDDPVIKYFVEQLESKAMGGTTVGAGASPHEIGRFMANFYAFEQLSGIVYAGTEGLPEKHGNSVSMIQKVRLPREVLLGGAGLCIELAALFASVSEAAGLDPVIFTTAKHAFPGVRVNGEVVAFEATSVGLPGMGEKRTSFDDALKAGQQNKAIWMNGGNQDLGPRILVLDLHYLHHVSGIVPPELPDDPAARAKIDEILARLLSGGNRAQQAPAARPAVARSAAPASAPAPAPPPPSSTPEPSQDAGATRYSDPNGFFTVSLPAGWQAHPYPVSARFRSLALEAFDPRQTMRFSVLVFPGTPSAETAFGQLRSYVTSLGGQMKFNEQAPVNNRGRDYRQFYGGTAYPQG